MNNHFLSNYFNKSRIYISLFFLALIVAVNDVFFSSRIFFITEGWWETYAHFNRFGFDLYEKSYLKLAPLYPKLIEFFQQNISESLLKIRLIFIPIHLIILISFFLFLRKRANDFFALIGLSVALGLVISNPVYLAKDYHTLVELLTVFLLVCLPLAAFSNFKKYLINTFSLGIICGLLLLSKQNIGIILTFFLGLSFLFELYFERSNFKRYLIVISIFLFSFSIPLVVYSTLFGFQWISIFHANDSKGSFLHILFKFISSPNIRIFTFSALFLTFFLFYFREKIISFLKGLSYEEIIAIFLLFLVISYRVNSLLFVFALSWPLSRFLFIKNKKDLKVSFVLLGLAYAGTTTAGYNSVSMEFLVGLFIAEFSTLLIGTRRIKNYLNIKMIVPSLILLLILLPKITSPFGYNWWGLKSAGFLNSNKPLTEEVLRGIFSDESTVSMIDSISEYKKYLSYGDKILAYPSIPIAYLILNKQPYANPVLWFDASTKGDSTKTITEMSKKLPKVIFWLRPPLEVYKGHFKLAGQDPGLIEVDEWLESKLYDGTFKLVKAIISFDPKFEYQTNYENISITIKKSINSISEEDLNRRCIINNCEIRDNDTFLEVKFKSRYNFKNFINNSKYIVEAENHIFYIFERVKNN